MSIVSKLTVGLLASACMGMLSAQDIISIEKPADFAQKRQVAQADDGAIILMHDIKDNTPESGRLAAQWLYDNGFMCVTVEELFIQYQQDMTPNKVFYSVNTSRD